MNLESRKKLFQEAWWNKNRLSLFDKFILVSGRFMIQFMFLFSLYLISSQVLYKGILRLNESGYVDGIKNFFFVIFTRKDPVDGIDETNIIIILFFGFILYIIKRRQQFYYGLLETIFALFNCQIVSDIIQSSLTLKSNKTYGLFITGMTTLYLLIRGISNIREGYDKQFLLKHRLWLLDILLLDYKDIRKKYNIVTRD